MGCGIRMSKSSYDETAMRPVRSLAGQLRTLSGNPDPAKFEIVKRAQSAVGFAVMVHYPGCANYEGNKVLVYETDQTPEQVIAYNGGTLDPHFSDNPAFISPLARFRPDDKGWFIATKLIGCI